jgi:hypothetical protein
MDREDDVQFEWDERKRKENIDKHSVDFLDAAAIFLGDRATVRDTRDDYGEERFQTIGVIDGDCYVVVYTHREGRVRLISARRGGRRDRRRYQDGVAGRNSGDAEEGRDLP